MVFANYDDSIRHGNSAFDVGVYVGKKKEAKDLISKFYSKREEIVRETPRSKLLEKLDNLYHSLLQKGAKLIEGVPVQKVSEIPHLPAPSLPKIVEVAEKEGCLDIGTLTCERFVEEFRKQNKEKLPSFCRVVSSSKLGTVRIGDVEVFTGKISRYSGIQAKGDSYRGGTVFANSIADAVSCLKAWPNYEIYITKNSNENIPENGLLEEFLEESGISFLKA